MDPRKSMLSIELRLPEFRYYDYYNIESHTLTRPPPSPPPPPFLSTHAHARARTRVHRRRRLSVFNRSKNILVRHLVN